MKGQYLNEEHWYFLSSLESMIEDIREHLTNGISPTTTVLIKVMEALDE